MVPNAIRAKPKSVSPYILLIILSIEGVTLLSKRLMPPLSINSFSPLPYYGRGRGPFPLQWEGEGRHY